MTFKQLASNPSITILKRVSEALQVKVVDFLLESEKGEIEVESLYVKRILHVFSHRRISERGEVKPKDFICFLNAIFS